MQSRFNHIALYVADLQKSTAFYRDIIDAEIIPDPFQDGRHVWFKIGKCNQLHLIAASESPQTGNIHFAFAVPSLDAFVGRLNQFGIRYEDGKGRTGQVRLRPDGVKQIYLQDPDGYPIEINEDQF